MSKKHEKSCSRGHRIEKLVQVGLIIALLLMVCSMCRARDRYDNGADVNSEDVTRWNGLIAGNDARVDANQYIWNNAVTRLDANQAAWDAASGSDARVDANQYIWDNAVSRLDANQIVWNYAITRLDSNQASWNAAAARLDANRVTTVAITTATQSVTVGTKETIILNNAGYVGLCNVTLTNGSYDGQTVLVYLANASTTAYGVKLVSGIGNLSLTDSWVRSSAGGWIRLKWDSTSSLWQEIDRDISVSHTPIIPYKIPLKSIIYRNNANALGGSAMQWYGARATMSLESGYSDANVVAGYLAGSGHVFAKAVLTATSGSSSSVETKTGTTNWNNKQIVLWYKLNPIVGTDPNTDPNKIATITLRIHTLGDTNVHYGWINLYVCSAGTTFPSYENTEGWHVKSLPINVLSAVSSPDYNDIYAVTLVVEKLNEVAAYTPSITLGGFAVFTPPNKKGIVSVLFDGGYLGQGQGIAYANQLGIPCSLDLANSDLDDATRLPVRAVSLINNWYGANNLITSYAKAFQLDWTAMGTADIRRESIRVNAEKLSSRVGAKGLRVVMVPGLYTLSESDLFTMMNGQVDCFIGMTQSPTYTPSTLWDVQRQVFTGINDYTSSTVPLLDVSKTIATKGFTSFIWHDPNATGAEWTAFTQVMDAIKAGMDAGTLEALTPMDVLTGNFTKNLETESEIKLASFSCQDGRTYIVKSGSIAMLPQAGTTDWTVTIIDGNDVAASDPNVKPYNGDNIVKCTGTALAANEGYLSTGDVYGKIKLVHYAFEPNVVREDANVGVWTRGSEQ